MVWSHHWREEPLCNPRRQCVYLGRHELQLSVLFLGKYKFLLLHHGPLTLQRSLEKKLNILQCGWNTASQKDPQDPYELWTVILEFEVIMQYENKCWSILHETIVWIHKTWSFTKKKKKTLWHSPPYSSVNKHNHAVQSTRHYLEASVTFLFAYMKILTNLTNPSLNIIHFQIKFLNLCLNQEWDFLSFLA